MMLFSQELPLHAITVAPSNPPISVNVSPYHTSLGEVYQITKYILSDITGIDAVHIHYTDYLMSDLGLDSLDMFQLVIETERYFNIRFNEVDLLNSASKLTVSGFADIVYHFCISDGDYVKSK